MAEGLAEISVRGKWVEVPSLVVNDDIIVVTGRWIRMAAVHDEIWAEREIEDPREYIKALTRWNSESSRSDIFTFTQKPISTCPKYSYPFEEESIAAIRLNSFKEWWDGLPHPTRKYVRQARKRGVVVEVKEFGAELIQGIMDVNNDSPVRQGRRYTHYGKSHDQVMMDHSSFVDRSEFICAYLGSEMIGFLKVVFRGNVASILQLTPKTSRNHLHPANAMLAKAIERCEARGASCVTYGLFNYGNKGKDSLQAFKVRNGFWEILVPRYYVPLSLWGRVCVYNRLYRGLLGMLPRGLIILFVNARARMYAVAARMGRFSSTLERSNRVRQMERSIPPAGSK